MTEFNEDEKKELQSIIDETKEADRVPAMIMAVAALGSGLFHGYCDAQGINLSDKTEFALTYMPIAVNTGFGAFVGWDLSQKLAEFMDRKVKKDQQSDDTLEDVTESRLVHIAYKVLGAGAAFGTGVTFGAVTTIHTCLGYGVGFGIGYISR